MLFPGGNFHFGRLQTNFSGFKKWKLKGKKVLCSFSTSFSLLQFSFFSSPFFPFLFASLFPVDQQKKNSRCNTLRGRVPPPVTLLLVWQNKTTYNVELCCALTGDSMTTRHKDQPFSTHDADNDAWSSNCAVRYKGSWWYKDCYHANLNGQYLPGPHDDHTGVNWNTWKGDKYSLKETEMKIRPYGI